MRDVGEGVWQRGAAGGVCEGFWSWEREWEWFKGSGRREKRDLGAILELGENLRELLERKQRKKERKKCE